MDGLQKVSRTLLKTLPAEIIKELSAMTRDEARALRNMVKSRMPVKSGRTAAQLKIRRKAKGLVYSVVFSGDRAFIARMLDLGTKHITPRNIMLEPTLPRRRAFQVKLKSRIVTVLKAHSG